MELHSNSSSVTAPILSRGGVGVLTLEIPKYLATLQASHAHQIRLMIKMSEGTVMNKILSRVINHCGAKARIYFENYR